MNINEKSAYLKGLFDGSDLNKDSKEVKIIGEMLDLLFNMSEKISELEAENAELREYIEEIDEDLGNLEEDFLTLGDDEDFEDYSDLNDEEEDENFDDEEEDYYEIECPSCGEKICFTDDIEIEELVCPACGELVGDTDLVGCGGDCEDCEGCE